MVCHQLNDHIDSAARWIDSSGDVFDQLTTRLIGTWTTDTVRITANTTLALVGFPLILIKMFRRSQFNLRNNSIKDYIPQFRRKRVRYLRNLESCWSQLATWHYEQVVQSSVHVAWSNGSERWTIKWMLRRFRVAAFLCAIVPSSVEKFVERKFR